MAKPIGDISAPSDPAGDIKPSKSLLYKLYQVEALTQSVLVRAFRGELVPTEAEIARTEGRDYESAEQLLARIREEAPTRGPARKRAKRPTGVDR